MKGIKILQHKVGEWFKSFAQDFAKGIRIGIGFLFIIGTAGIFAVAVTGTFNTFTSGSVMKAADINANFASLKAAIEGIPTQPAMRLIYETDITTATTTFTLNGLNGDSDIEYEIVYRIIGSAGSAAGYFIRPNSDPTTSNYGFGMVYTDQTVTGTAGAVRATSHQGMLFVTSGFGNNSGGVFVGKSILFAKTGYNRVLQSQGGKFLSTGDYWTQSNTSWWANNLSNINSLQFIADVANGFGAGSHIEVWARR